MKDVSRQSMKLLSILIMVAMLAACATQPPASISRVPSANLSVNGARLNPESAIGVEVRWGGVITKVENKSSQTWVEVVSHGLGKDGKPQTDGGSDGRFIAVLSGFADPLVYQAGHLLTVVGTIQSFVNQPIGEYQYSFPLVSVSGSFMWRVIPEEDRSYYPPPWWYYDPWYYRPYPLHPRYR